MVFIIATESKLEQKLEFEQYGIDVTNLAMCLELWVGKAVACRAWPLSCCGIWEDNAESCAR